MRYKFWTKSAKFVRGEDGADTAACGPPCGEVWAEPEFPVKVDDDDD